MFLSLGNLQLMLSASIFDSATDAVDAAAAVVHHNGSLDLWLAIVDAIRVCDWKDCESYKF
jgi:hypothetical protein